MLTRSQALVRRSASTSGGTAASIFGSMLKRMVGEGVEQRLHGGDRLALGAHLGLADLRPRPVLQPAGQIGDPVEALVVKGQQHAVGGDPPVGLQVAVAHGHRPAEGGQRVLAADLRRSAPVGERDRLGPIQERETGLTPRVGRAPGASAGTGSPTCPAAAGWRSPRRARAPRRSRQGWPGPRRRRRLRGPPGGSRRSPGWSAPRPGTSKKRWTRRSSSTSVARKNGVWHSTTCSIWSRWPARWSGRGGTLREYSSSAWRRRSFGAPAKRSTMRRSFGGVLVSLMPRYRNRAAPSRSA